MYVVVAQVLSNLFRLVSVFGTVALSGPLSAILLFFGAVITLFAIAMLVYLVVGAILSALGNGLSSVGGSPPEAK